MPDKYLGAIRRSKSTVRAVKALSASDFLDASLFAGRAAANADAVGIERALIGISGRALGVAIPELALYSAALLALQGLPQMPFMLGKLNFADWHKVGSCNADNYTFSTHGYACTGHNIASHSDVVKYTGVIDPPTDHGTTWRYVVTTLTQIVSPDPIFGAPYDWIRGGSYYTKDVPKNAGDSVPSYPPHYRDASRPLLRLWPFSEPVSYIPTVYAEAIPLLGQAPSSRPVPYTLLPSVQPNTSLVSPYRREVYYGTDFGVERETGLPSMLPSEIPSVVNEAVLQPQRALVFRPKRALHQRRKPRSGEKEKKWTVASTMTYQVFGEMMGLLTETTDFVDVFYYALPKEDRVRAFGGGEFRKANVFQKAMAVRAHLDDLDMHKVLQNFLITKAIDDAGGLVARKVLKPISQRLGLPIGVQSLYHIGKATYSRLTQQKEKEK